MSHYLEAILILLVVGGSWANNVMDVVMIIDRMQRVKEKVDSFCCWDYFITWVGVSLWRLVRYYDNILLVVCSWATNYYQYRGNMYSIFPGNSEGNAFQNIVYETPVPSYNYLTFIWVISKIERYINVIYNYESILLQ